MIEPAVRIDERCSPAGAHVDLILPGYMEQCLQGIMQYGVWGTKTTITTIHTIAYNFLASTVLPCAYISNVTTYIIREAPKSLDNMSAKQK